MSPPSPSPTSLDHCPSDFEPIMIGSFFAAGFAEAVLPEPEDVAFAAGAVFAAGLSAVRAAALSSFVAAGLAIGLR